MKGSETAASTYQTTVFSVQQQSVYKFSLLKDAQINICFSICKPIYKLLPPTNQSLLLVPLASCSRFSVVSNTQNVTASMNGLHHSFSHHSQTFAARLILLNVHHFTLIKFQRNLVYYISIEDHTPHFYALSIQI